MVLTSKIWKSGLAADKAGACDTGGPLSVTSNSDGRAGDGWGAENGGRHCNCVVEYKLVIKVAYSWLCRFQWCEAVL